MKTVAVIGGGVTGLVAAYELQKAGASVRLFESSDNLGGPVHSFRENGYLAEAGPNTLLETTPEISSLINELGLESRRLNANSISKKRFIVRNGKPAAVPTSPGSFFSSSLFSFSAKLRLFREPFVGKKVTDTDESLADFVRRRLGQEFLDYAIDPFVAGVYAGDPQMLSAKQAFGKVVALEETYGSLIRGQIAGRKERRKSGSVAKDRAKMFSFDEGLQVLIDALAAKLMGCIRLQTSVERIEQNQGWNLFAKDESLGIFDAVIITIPAYRLAGLTISGRSKFPSLEPLSQIYYPPVTSLALGFRREDILHPLNGFGMLIPKIEGFSILGTLFSSTLFPHRAPEGEVLLTSYIGGARNPDLALLPDKELIDLVNNDLRTLLEVTGKPTYIHRSTFERAIPQYQIGYKKYKELMTAFEQAAAGFFIAGNFRGGIALSDCIVNAKLVAKRSLSA